MNKCLLALVLAWAIVPVFGQEKDSSSIGLLEYEISEVVIQQPTSNQKDHKLLSIGYRVELDDMSSSSQISLVGNLNQIPGVLDYSGALNTSRILIRGIGSRTPYSTNRIKAFLDGIPLSSSDGTTVLEDIDPILITNVHVEKGSKSALYGAGLGGVILLSTKEKLARGFHGKAGVTFGKFNTQKAFLKSSFFKKNFYLNAFYSDSRTNGYRENSNYRKNTLYTGATRIGKVSQTKFTLLYTKLEAQIPSSLNKTMFENSPQSAANNWLGVQGYEAYEKIIGGFHNEFKLGSRWSQHTTIYGQFKDAYESRPFNILDDDFLQTGIRTSIQYKYNNWSGLVGGEASRENYQWQIFETNNGAQEDRLNRNREIRQLYSTFTNATFYSRFLRVESGLHYQILSYELKDLHPDSIHVSGDYQFKPILSPYLGVSLLVTNNLQLFASAGHGFSYPTVEETLLQNGYINRKLKPETGITIDGGLSGNFLDERLQFDLTFYQILTNNLLVTERESEDVFYGKNAGTAKYIGTEIAGSCYLPLKNPVLPDITFRASYSTSKNTFTEYIQEEIDYGNKQLPGIPSYSFNGSLDMNFLKGIFVTLAAQSLGKQFLNDINNGTYSSYQTFNTKLGQSYERKNFTLKYYLGIDNIFDTKYASMILINAPSFGANLPRYYYPARPRYFYFGFSINF